MPKTFSADVELYLKMNGSRYELGHLGPGFALLAEQESVGEGIGEIEMIIDGKATRLEIRVTAPPSAESRRFEFESASSE
ncbi:hypothetical protein Enr13x_35750 [Stieleria neptunia]|uniref:Uncharacterized protein n=1 Tax=Stieleria neptunia TaxID=2527979 RepID=A0A518HSE9_9BACT|nr:hypothetical protein [Stieleria neptunia]QDV43718.1 hypothetical protein Enr13x_35750 [Stieleria neptunia]